MSDRPTIRLGRVEDLLALIPFLLGFHPEDSLVLLALTGDAVAFLIRVDLPGPHEPLTALHTAADLVNDQLPTRDRASVVLVGYGPAATVQPALGAVGDALRDAGIPLGDVLRVADGRYWRRAGLQPSDGVPFDPATSPAAATAVHAGLVALPSRDALADTLAAITGPARDRMAAATAAACEVLLHLLGTAGADTTGDPDTALYTPVGLGLQAAARPLLTQALDSYRQGRPVGDDHAALLTVLLDLPTLRDFAARRTSREAWQIDMWTDLVRRAATPFTAGPATLLALCALRGGDGALANLAIQRALDTDPDDQLAQLLAAAIAAGIDPDTLDAMLAEPGRHRGPGRW